MTNALYFGDNLLILTGRDSHGKPYFPDECVDLVYLDPPFNSNRSYNILFRDDSGHQAPAQIRAFEDTWRWANAIETYDRTVTDPDTPHRVVRVLDTLHALLGTSEMMAYLVMMTPRLLQLHRVLKRTGSLYLHCDPTASHYLKVILDTIFGPENFKNEITWQRTNAHNDPKRYGNNVDIILFYTKSKTYTWHPQYTPHDPSYIANMYRYVEEGTGRRYRLGDLTAAKPGGDVSYEWKGVKPYKGRYWAYSRANMEKYEAEGRLVYSKSGMPQYKRYLDEMPGVPLQALWTDITFGSGSAERLGYPTQKPVALLKRIIGASSNPGDVVLDPFCGCGTAVDAAQELGREWRGIDITHLAVALMKSRLFDRYGIMAGKDYEVHGEPEDLGSARALWEQDTEQFEYWALGLIGARPWEGKQQKGADKGRDGVLRFQDTEGGRSRTAVVSVKGGKNIERRDIGDLVGTVAREKAEMGIFITLHPPTKPMVDEAASAGMYEAPFTHEKVRKVQILTVAELLDGREVQLPKVNALATYRRARRAATPSDYLQPGLAVDVPQTPMRDG